MLDDWAKHWKDSTACFILVLIFQMYWIYIRFLETAMDLLTKNLEMHLFFAAKIPNEITCAGVTPGIRETCHLGAKNRNCGR